MRVGGLDGGTANLGAAVLDYNPAIGPKSARCVFADRFTTERAAARLKRRVCTDDRIRLGVMAEAMIRVHREHRVEAWGIEWYLPMARNANGWKTGMVVGAGFMLAAVLEVPAYEQLPGDVKRLVGDPEADKAQVIAWAMKHIRGFKAAVAHLWHPGMSETKRVSVLEHPADAACHALVTIHELHARRSA